MKFKNSIVAILIGSLFLTNAVEAQDNGGMWLLPKVQEYNKVDMESKGIHIPVEQIAVTDHALSESVVQFGKGCTASFISSAGLLLTNYHCAYGAIGALDNPTRNIWINGYWAKDYNEELAVPGLTVTVNKKIVDISKEVWALLKPDATQEQFNAAIKSVEESYKKRYPSPLKTLVKSYNSNHIVTLYIQQQYDDVRLVGLAPKSVTKFGGETDNWTWPRHSGDFALFRVYVNMTGGTAKVKKQPLKPSNWLKTSLDGIQKEDFAMSLGFPMMSDRYSTSFQVEEKVTAVNPAMIAARKLVMDTYSREMEKSDRIRMMYQEKYAEMANYYKNAVGMNHWVDTLHLIAKKQEVEKVWLNAVPKNSQESVSRSKLYTSIQQKVADNMPYLRALNFLGECSKGCELMQYVSAFGASYLGLENKPNANKNNLITNLPQYYSRFDMAVNKLITADMLCLMLDSLPDHLQPSVFTENNLKTRADVQKYVDRIYAESILADSAKLMAWLKNPTYSIKEDIGYQMGISVNDKQREMFKIAIPNGYAIKGLVDTYKKSMAAEANGAWYPDADQTIRLSYGKIDDLRLGSHVKPFYTTMSGILEKAKSDNKDYTLHPRLAELAKRNPDAPVCFIAEGDVTGGNSGSPMMNADGNLIGLVFDCNWESMTREFNFDKELNRVICVDIRYVLTLIDEFSGSDRIRKELSIVGTK